MSDDKRTESEPEQITEFEELASRGQSGLIAQFVDYLLHNKKWWLTPIIVALLLVGALVIVGATGAGPFIYALF